MGTGSCHGAAMKREGTKGGPGQGRRENTTQRLASPSQPMCAVCWGKGCGTVDDITLVCGVTHLEACGGVSGTLRLPSPGH